MLAMAGSVAFGPFSNRKAPSTGPRIGIRGGGTLRLFLCGDVMLGRGIDQILPHRSDPRIYEPAMSTARGYVELAEKARLGMPWSSIVPWIWKSSSSSRTPSGKLAGGDRRRRNASRL